MEESFSELCERNRKRLWSIARSYAEGDEVGDLYQEILLELWKSLESYEGRSQLDTWAYRVALNTAISYGRKVRRQSSKIQSFRDEQPEPQAKENPANELAMLEEFIRSLNKVDRAIFLLYLDNLSYRDMTAITGLKENHLAVKINRIKNVFKDRYIRA
jgi:RNA polymerase sigma-70 factor (ECF subfamily)